MLTPCQPLQANSLYELHDYWTVCWTNATVSLTLPPLHRPLNNLCCYCPDSTRLFIFVSEFRSIISLLLAENASVEGWSMFTAAITENLCFYDLLQSLTMGHHAELVQKLLIRERLTGSLCWNHCHVIMVSVANIRFSVGVQKPSRREHVSCYWTDDKYLQLPPVIYQTLSAC